MTTAPGMDQQAEQKQQHEKGAWVEGIQSGKHQRKYRQGKSTQIKIAKQWKLHVYVVLLSGKYLPARGAVCLYQSMAVTQCVFEC